MDFRRDKVHNKYAIMLNKRLKDETEEAAENKTVIIHSILFVSIFFYLICINSFTCKYNPFVLNAIFLYLMVSCNILLKFFYHASLFAKRSISILLSLNSNQRHSFLRLSLIS